MAALKKTEFMTGKLYWAKILGDPVLNYEKTAREWTLEFEPDEDGVAILKAHKLTDRLKDKYVDQGRGKYLTLRKKELSMDGKENPPIRIYDADDQNWDPKLNAKGVPTNLIGNESLVDIKVDIRDYGAGKKKGIYPTAIRVIEHVPYESTEFGGMDTGRPERQKEVDTFKKDFGLDDDIGDVGDVAA